MEPNSINQKLPTKCMVSQEDIDVAKSTSAWDFGNKVLYKLCEEHPYHNNEQEIIAKVWLIGRAYAAALERKRKNLKIYDSDEFYEKIVVNEMKSFDIDRLLSELPNKLDEHYVTLGQAISLHKKLVDRFKEMTGLDKRSLASKYLHFHKPLLFYIYDSRANASIKSIVSNASDAVDIIADDYDKEYLIFCRRCQWLVDNIYSIYGKRLTPRQIDKMLLHIASKKAKQ